MHCKGVQGQTLLDFYLSLSERQVPTDCCGPLIYMEMPGTVVQKVAQVLSLVDKKELIANAYIASITNNSAKFGSCAAHWLDMSAITTVIGARLYRNDLSLIGHSLAVLLCEQAGWDYKELDNYLRSKVVAGWD
jgi:hypothetical protein